MTPAATGAAAGGSSVAKPPAWLVAATCLLAAASLVMAVAETSLWTHYLIDAGEYVSLSGLAFILIAGLYLHRSGRLAPSLPLVLPWILLPVITQGDQIIDNLSINWMRFISHVLLGLLFGAPVAVIALSVRPWLRDGARTALVVGLLFAEMWIAVRFLGLLMVVTLALMIAGVLAGAWWRARRPAPEGRRRGTGRFALAALVGGVALSFGLYLGFKNRPGAYQGSPAHYMDPAQADDGFRLDRVSLSPRPPSAPAAPDAIRATFTTYGRAFQRLLEGYYILDRNYNYDFHNRLFLRNTPLLAGYREAGLARVREAQAIRTDADTRAAALRPTLAADDPIAVLLADIAAYSEFIFGRTPVVERMSAEFERTEAGLQHATHLFEGEGKMLSERLGALLDKHHAVLNAEAVRPALAEFTEMSRSVRAAYASRIVGF